MQKESAILSNALKDKSNISKDANNTSEKLPPTIPRNSDMSIIKNQETKKSNLDP